MNYGGSSERIIVSFLFSQMELLDTQISSPVKGGGGNSRGSGFDFITPYLEWVGFGPELKFSGECMGGFQPCTEPKTA
jgi:hypothetical protein